MIKFILNFRGQVPRATQLLLFLLVALIPFSVRYVIDSPWNYQTGAYSDFTSFSIYISDLVLLALVVLGLFPMKQANIPGFWKISAAATVVWLIIEALLQESTILPFQIYFSIRLVLLIALAYSVTNIQFSREKLAWLFTVLGSLQGVIAALQFYYQKSIGLYLLGESHLSPETLGVAKIVAHGTKMIRGYGTFPHPNLLAAFLLTSTIFNLYLLAKNYQKPRGIYLYILLFINIFGLFLTFSRGGILALGISIAVIASYFLVNKECSKIYKVIIPVLAGIVISVGILSPFLMTRATIADNSTKERLFYSKIGEEIISEQPLAGVGPGTSVLHMKQYSETVLEPWEIQPIHNYYLISWAELGIGALFFLILTIYPFSALFKANIREWGLFLASAGLGYGALFLFDHYFYTIWPTQLLLWLAVGLSHQAVSREATLG